MKDAKFKKWFVRHNVGYKLLAFMLSVLLWYFVTGQRDPLIERTFTRPVEPRFLSQNMVLVSPLPDVSVRVRGANSLMKVLNVEDVRVFVDLAAQGTGMAYLPVKAEAPFGIQVIAIKPDKVMVKLDTRAEKKVPVKVSVQGKPATGFTFLNPVVSPDSVTVEGPGRMLEKIQEVKAVVRLQGEKSSVTTKVSVSPEVPAGLKVEPGQVKVVVPVLLNGPVKEVPVTVDLKGKPRSGFIVQKIYVSPDRVQVTGDAAALAGITSVLTQPVDISDADESIQKVVGLSLPQGVYSAGQDKVTVNIEIVGGEPEQLQP